MIRLGYPTTHVVSIRPRMMVAETPEKAEESIVTSLVFANGTIYTEECKFRFDKP